MMGVMAERLGPGTEAVPGPSAPIDFGAWMMAEQRRVFGLCLRILRETDEAETATQDTFLKAHQALTREDREIPRDPGKWLRRIAVNTCLDRLRSRSWKFWRRRRSVEDEELILKTASGSAPSAEDRVFAGEIERRLSLALEGLSARQRAVFTLKHYEDRRLEEIAEILDLDVGTVKAHMARAVAKLRTELRDLYEMGGKK
jgi:RNA polymerase sigma-70 factor (ECF subfamily)